MAKSCANCRKKNTCQRLIRQMASEQELQDIVCFKHQVLKSKGGK